MYIENTASNGIIAALIKDARSFVIDAIVDDAKRYAPVDTGYLRDHISADHTKGIIIADAPYAAAQELGAPSKHISAQPYLRPALYKNRVIEVHAS